MTPEKFREILWNATNGSHEAFEQILEQYMPLINKYSWINGKFDEDLKQYILMHIALYISRFKV